MAMNAIGSLKMTPITVIPTAIIMDKTICDRAFLLYAYLTAYIDKDGTGKFPGYDKIRADLGWEKRVHPLYYIQELEHAGWLSRFSNGGKVSNRYWLALRPNDFRV